MKKLIYPVLILLLTGLWGCGDDSSPTGPDPDPGGQEASAEKQFVWNAMNEWYLYQAQVPDLADSRFSGDAEFQEYLNGFASAEALFGELQIADDPYSFFIDDYEEYEQQQDGIYAALGFNYGYILLSDEETIIGYVQYVVPDSPADNAGLERGDIFTQIDGTSLNINNYAGLLRDNSAHTLTMAEIRDNNVVETGETITVEQAQVQEDPIYLSTVIDTSNTKVGYLMYNAFQGNSHAALNDVMSDFQAQGIDELVLDLRYNGGGAVITSQTLASMISGLGSENVYAHFRYNEKKSQYDGTEYFLEEVPIRNEQGDYDDTIPMNTLNLDRLYVLTSNFTASASEALINSLKPFMEVILIGYTTEGKDVGSVTLYDAAPNYTNKTNINPDHKKAIQPIVVAITNTDGERYRNGFAPDTEVREHHFLEDLPPIGSPDDPLFSEAISMITGQPAKRARPSAAMLMRESSLLEGSTELQPRRSEMYIEPFMLPGVERK